MGQAACSGGMDLGEDSGWSRTLDAGWGVSPSQGGDKGSESGTAILRGVVLTRQAQEAAPQKFLGGHTEWSAEPRAEPEPVRGSSEELNARFRREVLALRALQSGCAEERVTGQAPCYAEMRTVSPVHIHSPVRSILCLLPAFVLRCVSSARCHPYRSHGPGFQCTSTVHYILCLLPALVLRCVSPARLNQCHHNAPDIQ